jgi:hypothetical protein
LNGSRLPKVRWHDAVANFKHVVVCPAVRYRPDRDAIVGSPNREIADGRGDHRAFAPFPEQTKSDGFTDLVDRHTAQGFLSWVAVLRGHGWGKQSVQCERRWTKMVTSFIAYFDFARGAFSFSNGRWTGQESIYRS